MAHLGSGGFDSIGGQVVSATAFILERQRSQQKIGLYINLTDVDGEGRMADLVRQANKNFARDYCYRVRAFSDRSESGRLPSRLKI
jgi:hypothetical protein